MKKDEDLLLRVVRENVEDVRSYARSSHASLSVIALTIERLRRVLPSDLVIDAYALFLQIKESSRQIKTLEHQAEEMIRRLDNNTK